MSDFLNQKSGNSNRAIPKLKLMPIDDSPPLLPGHGVYPIENAVSHNMDAYNQIRVQS